MAIIKRSNGTYQAKYRGSDGRWITKSFQTKRDAEEYDNTLKKEKRGGEMLSNEGKNLSFDEFSELWFELVKNQGSFGWRRIQKQLYADFVKPVLGGTKIVAIRPPAVSKVLNRMADMGRAPLTQNHVYGMMRHMFRDAIETFRLVAHNPVLRSFKPKGSTKVAPHLNLSQARELLAYVREKPYGAAIWIQFFLGLRVGEMQALRWEDIDLDVGMVHIRRAYVRKERAFKDYPKGRRQHSKVIPPELLEVFKTLSAKREGSELVLRSSECGMLSYEWFNRTLQRYCKALGLPPMGTHGLRHSTSNLYLTNGASKEDIRSLMAHSSSAVTERYIHHVDTRLSRVARSMQLFPVATDSSQYECSQNVPISGKSKKPKLADAE